RHTRWPRDWGSDVCSSDLAGQIVMRSIDTRDARGTSIDVPDGLVHHWLGAIFVPNVALDDLLVRLQNTPAETYQDDVVSSAILKIGRASCRDRAAIESTEV